MIYKYNYRNENELKTICSHEDRFPRVSREFLSSQELLLHFVLCFLYFRTPFLDELRRPQIFLGKSFVGNRCSANKATALSVLDVRTNLKRQRFNKAIFVADTLSNLICHISSPLTITPVHTIVRSGYICAR